MNHPYAPPRRRPAPDMDWRTRATCRIVPDKTVFFPRRGALSVRDTAIAKAICSACPVLEQCREYALAANPQEGVFGGTTPQERRRLRNARRAQVAA